MGLHYFGVHQLQAQSFNKNSRNPMIFTFYFKPTLSFVILFKKNRHIPWNVQLPFRFEEILSRMQAHIHSRK